MSTLVGIQMGAISLADEGVPEVLDTVKRDAGVNAVFVATQAFDRGVQGRQVDWRPWPVLTTSPWGWLMLAKEAGSTARSIGVSGGSGEQVGKIAIEQRIAVAKQEPIIEPVASVP